MALARLYNEWLLERAGPYLGDRVLDFGAGTGTFTELVATGRRLVVAAEPDPEYVPRLRERFAGRSNVEVLALAGGAELAGDFDSALCLNVLEHIHDDAGALRWLRAALRPGGRLLLLVPAHPFLYGPIDEMLEHERRYAKRALRALLGTSGFEVEVLRRVNPVGAVGWLVSGRLLRRRQIPGGPLRLYDMLVPALRALDRVELPLGLSLWAVARRPEETGLGGR